MKLALLLRCGVAAMLLALGAQPAGAQDYPTQPVRFIVPFPPGGAADLLTRLLAQKLGDAMKGSFLVENRPGGNTIIAASAVAKAPPDGHMLLVAVDSTLTMNKSLYRRLPYDPFVDFAPVVLLAEQPMMFAANPNAPFKTVAELVSYARANPGKLNIGVGALVARVAAEQLKLSSGIDFQIIQYQGSAPSRTALLSGNLDATFSDVASPAPFIKDGRMVALGTTGLKRASGQPNIPAISEQGYPGFDVKSWYAVVAPAGTPAPIVARLNAEISRALQSPEIQQRIGEQGLDLKPGSPADLGAFMKSEYEKWDKVLKAAKVPMID
jgi:tripartite-type tricarboxylate transporter receptor subunit TctC